MQTQWTRIDEIIVMGLQTVYNILCSNYFVFSNTTVEWKEAIIVFLF